MLLFLIVINLIIYNLVNAIGIIDGRENFVINEPEETNDVALPVLNVYYEQPLKDWKYETEKESQLMKFQRDIDQASENMKSDAISLLDAIARERKLISKLKFKVVKKQLAPNLNNS